MPGGCRFLYSSHLVNPAVNVPLRPVVAGCVLWALSAHASLAAAGPLKWALKVEGGSEYDTNIHRFEVPTDCDDDCPNSEDSPIVASPLVRGGTHLRLGWRRDKRQRLSLAGFAGTKLYASEVGLDENTFVAAGDGRYEWSIPGRSAIVATRATFYDTWSPEGLLAGPGRVARRNFSSAGAGLALNLLGPGETRLALFGDYRGFGYKPNPDFNWHGGHFGVAYRNAIWRGDPAEDPASLEIGVSYGLQQRRFRGNATTYVCPEEEEPMARCVADGGFARADLFHAAGAEVVYTGQRIYSARYELEVTDSNSFGQSLTRQRLELGLTSRLVAGVFITAQVAVQLDIFLDSLILSHLFSTEDFTSIDDENRNSISVHLGRDVSDHWSVEARYALFSNEFSAHEFSFRRQIFYLGAVYAYAP